MRILIALIAFVGLTVLVLWQMPATLLDAALQRLGAGNLRLADASGTLWRGRGVLTSLDPVTHEGRPWLAMEWTTTPENGVVTWHFTSGSEALAHINLGLNGAALRQVRLRGPARYFLEQIPASVGRAGWLGDMAVSSPEFRCSWQKQCAGSFELLWKNAASELLTGRVLGDYQLTGATNTGGALAFQWRTLQGELRTEGQGQWPIGGAPSFNGTVQGDAQYLNQLPAVAGPWVHPAGEGVWQVRFP